MAGTSKPYAVFIGPLCLIVCLISTIGRAQPQPSPVPPTQPAAAAEINLLTMGDWGSGNASQRQVAKTMADYVTNSLKRFSGILLCGDNFYGNLRNVNDPQWQLLFEQMYDPVRLNFPFYPTLGNHDLFGNKAAIELNYSRTHPNSRWKFPSRWYQVDFPAAENPLVTVLMLDSNRSSMESSRWAEQGEWIGGHLGDRQAKWVICAAHHPLYSNGFHGDNGVLQAEWGSLFTRDKVDFYICGHDHDMQHLEIPGIRTSFLLVGGGGQDRRAIHVDKRGPFSKSVNGFTHLQIMEDKTIVRYIDLNGAVIHRFERTLSGRVTVLDSEPSDIAVPRTIRSITRGDEDPAAEIDATTKPVNNAPGR